MAKTRAVRDQAIIEQLLRQPSPYRELGLAAKAYLAHFGGDGLTLYDFRKGFVNTQCSDIDDQIAETRGRGAKLT